MRLMIFGLTLLAGMMFAMPWTTQSATQQDPKHFIVDIVTINGEEFVVKDDTGKEGKIHVGTDTEKFGRLQPGDRIDAWVFPNGHAKTVMILRSASIIQQEDEQRKQVQAQQPGGQAAEQQARRER